MKQTFGLLVALAAATGCANAVSINVFTAIAPNVYASTPGWSGWQANAVYAMKHGLTAYGDPNSPTYFQASSDYHSNQVIVTGFPSWMGVADAASVFGAAFANEYGNRMTFPLAIDGEGSQFSISQLSFEATSVGDKNVLGFEFAQGSYSYSDAYVGVRVGGDGKLGTADDVFITSGASTQLVNFLFGRGSGSSYDAYCDGCTIKQKEAAILDAASLIREPVTFTGTYTLTLADGSKVSGSDSFNINPVPEPATAATLGGALLALAAIFRRRLQK